MLDGLSNEPKASWIISIAYRKIPHYDTYIDLERERGKHVICKTCSANLFSALSFKSICLDTEDALFPYITLQEDLAIDLKEVYLKEKEDILLSENQKICRLCFQLITYKFTSLYEVDVNIMVNYLSQVNINSTKDPVICSSCFESLRIHGSFLQNCCQTLEKYVQYCDEADKHEIKVEESDKKSNLNAEEFKIDKTCFDVQEQYDQFYIKTEEINIKAEGDEESNSSSNSLSEGTNVSYEKEHSNHLAIINESVHKYEVRQDQVNKPKSNIQECESLSDISSTAAEYKNELNCDLKRKNGRKPKKNKPIKRGFETQLKENINQHQLLQTISSETQIYKCHECSFETRYEWCLNGHLPSHKKSSERQTSKIKKYVVRIDFHKCGKCNYSTEYRNALKTHLLTHKEPSKPQTYRCDACRYKTTHKSRMKRHQMKHENSYECETCHYKTTKKESLKRHMTKHKDPSDNSNIEMYECQKCCHKFKWKENLRRHQLWHKDSSEMVKRDSCSYVTHYKGWLEKRQVMHENSPKVDMQGQ